MQAGNGWTLWLDLVAQEYRERRLRALPPDYFGDTLPIERPTDGFELETELIAPDLNTRKFPTLLEEYLEWDGDDGPLH